MDIVYLFNHCGNQDFEIRQSLRSVVQHAPYIRKVWIFGDRPSFISDDTSLIEHVPHEYVAWILGIKTPVSNFFLMTVLSSLIPDLSFEYLRFSDDFFLPEGLPHRECSQGPLPGRFDVGSPAATRARLWKDSLWRTRDLLDPPGLYRF